MPLKMQSWNHATDTPCPRCETLLWWNGFLPCGGTMDCNKYICPECRHEFSEQLGKKPLLDKGETQDWRFVGYTDEQLEQYGPAIAAYESILEQLRNSRVSLAYWERAEQPEPVERIGKMIEQLEAKKLAFEGENPWIVR